LVKEIFGMRRTKLLLAVAAAMAMLMVGSTPAMANDWYWSDHRDFDNHDLFTNDFDDFDENFFELDDCELVSFFDDEAVLVCELDS
jgi:hypothetical protein